MCQYTHFRDKVSYWIVNIICIKKNFWKFHCVNYMSTENLLKKTKARRRRVYYPYVNYIVYCNPYKISYDQSDIWLSYLDIVCCGIPANCLRSQPGHNYALHWTRSSRRRLSLMICYWGFRLSFPRGLGQLQPSMAGRRKIQLLH